MRQQKLKSHASRLLIFLSIFLLSIYACGNKGVESTIQEVQRAEVVENVTEILVTKSQFELAGMKLGALSEKSFSTTIHTTGELGIPAKNYYKIGSYASGTVRSINLSKGQAVRKGQELFTLENPEFIEMQQEFLEASDQQKYLESDYMRQKQLAEEHVASQKNFLKAESAYRVNLSKLEGLKKRLSLLHINSERINANNLKSTITVYAPSKGYISSISATRGMYLNPTDIALELINTDEIFVEMYVFQKDILNVEKGQQVSFRPSDNSNELYMAEVTMISKIIDHEKRAALVKGKLIDHPRNERLVVGMYVDADIIVASKRTFGLPETAIVSDDGNDYVLVLEEGTNERMVFVKKLVQLGQKQGGYVEVLNNDEFQEIDQILIEGGFNLLGIE